MHHTSPGLRSHRYRTLKSALYSKTLSITVFVARPLFFYLQPNLKITLPDILCQNPTTFKMAFVTSSIRPFSVGAARSAKLTCVRGSAARVSATVAKRAVVVQGAAGARCAAWEGKYPPSDVLGLGKDVPSTLYILASVVALLLGCYSVYKSNIAQPLTPETVNPQFIVGSLLAPISWGL